MREVDFLPEWYPKARRRRRAVVVQAWATLLAALGVGLWLLVARTSVRSAQASLSNLDGELSSAKTQLDQLNQLRGLKAQLVEQDRLLADLGLPVDLARLTAELDRCMAPRMALTSLAVNTEERLRPVDAGAMRGKAGPPPPIDRTLRVSVVGVAATDIDVATFFAALNAVPFFEQANIRRSEEKIRDNRRMREFEVEFAVDLN